MRTKQEIEIEARLMSAKNASTHQEPMKTITVTIKVIPPTADSFQEFMHLIDYLQVNGYEYLINSDESLMPSSQPRLEGERPKDVLT